MKQLCALLLLQIAWGGIAAQLTSCDSASLVCSLDLTQPIFGNVKIDTLSYAKSPLPALFLDVKYKDDGYGKPVICLGPENDECLNDGSALRYYAYYPMDHDYTSCPLKPIVLMHAGGFAECSSFDLPLANDLAFKLAQRGFVVFNVEYRRGIVQDAITPTYTTAQQHLAPYRAAQDIRGFFRSMIKRERNKNSFPDDWRIDTNNVFIGGMSAGAFTALNVAWYTNSMIYSLYATPIASANIQYVLGSPDVNFYYGEPDLDFHDFYQPKIKGVFNCWGAIPMPYAAYANINDQPAFFSDSHLTPAILFHGYLDKTFPFIDDMPNSQDVNFSLPPNLGDSDYNSVDFCIKNNLGPFSVNASSTVIDLINGSSYNIYKMLSSYSKRCEIYVDCSMGHGLDPNSNYHSDFGSGATNQTQTAEYMASRIAVFFQKMFDPPQTYGKTIFVDCANTSKNCETNTNCTNRSCGADDLFPEN